MHVAPTLRAAACCAALLLFAGVASAQTTTVEARVTASLDDVEQNADLSMYVNSSDLELIHDSSDQIVGIRWVGLAIPKGATITTAWIQFSAKESQSEVTNLNFYGQAADAAPTFTTNNNDVGGRPRTAAVVTWSPVAWNAGEIGANQKTPDLKSIVQEVVSRSGWASGNPLVVIINGTGHRTAWAWDGNAAQAALLHVEYSTGGGQTDQPPTAAVSVTQSASPPLTVSASAAGSTDTDATPIASYSFNWGDGSNATVVNAPTQTASHTYASAGTYTVTLTVKDTGGLTSAPKTQSITVSAADQPPVAALSVTQSASPPLTVSASAAGSTDTDATPIASYSFDWGDGTTATAVNAPTLTASHTYSSAGTYTVTLAVKDTGGLTSTPKTQSITVNPASGSNTAEKRIAASSDDAEEVGSGNHKVTLNSPDLQLIHDTSNQTVGMRWTGLTIPKGATITTAWVQFTSTIAASGATSLTLRAQAADNAATFTTGNRNVSSRALTTASTAWAPAAWSAGEVGTNERTPSLSAVVQEVVSRSGWASGNALVVVVTGTGSRTASSFDGNAAQAPLLHVEYSTSGPTDQPPVASLAVSQAGSPALTVNASAAGSTDTDATPIAKYSFSWGDGSTATVVNAPTQTATHTYASAGTYTVTLVATDTGNLASTPVTKSITVTADAPPVASLAVTQAASPPLTVNASAAGSTDTDTTPIAKYSFSWGDGSTATVVNAPTQTASHTYASAGTYTVTLIVTDTGSNASAPKTASITVTSGSSSSPTAVYVGYYDTHHADNPQPKPNPWQGSPNVVFIGVSDHNDNNWDSACIRVDNLTTSTLSGVVVTADLGSSHFALWGTNSIPAGYHLILAQTAYQNFDGSDTNPGGCYGCDPNLCLTERSSDIPVVHVTVNSTTKDYFDKGQVTNTGGYDGAGCPYVGGPLPQTRYDESHPWAQVYTASGAAIVASPSASTSPPPNLPRELALAPPSPNPTHGVLALRFSLPSRGPVWLGLYDVLGRQVRTYLNNILDAGEYNLQRDLSDVRPGVYFVRLWTPSAVKHDRVIIAP